MADTEPQKKNPKIPVPANLKIKALEIRIRKLPSLMLEVTARTTFSLGIGVKNSIIGYNELGTMTKDFPYKRKFATKRGATKRAKKIARALKVKSFDLVWYRLGAGEQEIEIERTVVELEDL